MAFHIVAIPDGEKAASLPATPLATAYAVATLGWLLSAGVYIAAKWVAPEMPPWALCFWRLGLACLILLPVVRHHYAAMASLLRARPLELLVVAGLGLTACQGMLYTGLQYTDATTAGIIMALCPITTLVLAHLVLGEPMGIWQGVGAILSLIGMVVIVAHGDLAALVNLQLNAGELWIVGSAISWGLYTVLLKRLKFESERLPLLVMLLGLGAVAALPLYGWELAHDERSALDGNGLLALAYVAAPGGALMYYLYNRSVDTLGASRAGLMLYLQTAFVALLAYLFLGEGLHAYDLTGAAIIVAGLVIAMTMKPKAAAQVPGLSTPRDS
jgi:drug/metabolite transporter (DMT)-like permease